MKSAFWRSIAVVALVAIPVMANANDASIGSEVATDAMYGATLMNTTAVFNAFPHMVVENGTGVELNTMGDGFGRVWWEAYDGTWLTMDIGRMDYGLSGSSFLWGQGYSVLEPFDSTVFESAMFVNMGIARPLSGGGAWALGIKLAPFGGIEENPAGGTSAELNTTGYGVNASWGNGDGLHLSGEWAMSKVEQVDYFQAGTDEDKNMGFGVSARYDTDMYVYQGNFVWGTGELSGDNFDPSTDFTAFGFMAEAGRYLKNDVDGQATAEFGLGWTKSKEETGDAVNFDDTGFLLPSVRVAAWEKISRRFGLMGGVGFTHVFDTYKEDPTGTAEDETKTNGSLWDWSAGLFFQPTETVRIDARFQEGNLNQILSLGNDQPLVFYLGATVGLN